VHELGHLFASTVFAPRTDGIAFFARCPGTIALASFSKDKVTASRRISIAVAGAVATHDAAVAGGLGEQPCPTEVFNANNDELFPEFCGDRATVREFTIGLGADKKDATIIRAINRTRRELECIRPVDDLLQRHCL